jgi:hypothetical protein
MRVWARPLAEADGCYEPVCAPNYCEDGLVKPGNSGPIPRSLDIRALAHPLCHDPFFAVQHRRAAMQGERIKLTRAI